MKIGERPRRVVSVVVTWCALWASGCASVGDAESSRTPVTAAAPSALVAVQALRAGQVEAAREAALDWVARDPRAAAGHWLLAVAHHLRGDGADVELAASGYDVAQRHAAHGFWPHYLGGVAALQRQQNLSALDLLAQAVAAEPDNAWGLEAFAAAAYLQGEMPLALAAARRALRLDPHAQAAWRTGLLTLAAVGDEAGLRRWREQRGAWSEDSSLRQRAEQLLRIALSEGATAPAEAPGGEAADGAPANPPDQVTVDVVLMLADERKSSALGVNLLDSLQIQFGASRETTGTRGQPLSTAITRRLRIPEISYSLNIANRGGRRYYMLARPSLTAFSGQPSSFFVGEQLFVQVSGINSAQLEKIDVGVSLKIQPSEVRADGARFKVEADRSFFSDQGVSTFSQQLSTFKQSVSATADVKYGQTLVLSGLSESVNDGSTSGVPVLGDLPGGNLLLNRRTQLERQRSVLILVTPSQPVGLVTPSAGRSEAVERLARLWDRVIEPEHGLKGLAQRFDKRLSYHRPVVGDVQVRDLRDPRLRAAVLDALGRAVQATHPPALSRGT